jgi:ATP adenylyltransferase
MTDESSSTERNRNLWAPWRMEYIDALHVKDDSCFLCRYRDDAADDAANLVLWRSQRCLVLLNRFPYNGGHSMIAPLEHVPDLASLDGETMLDIMHLLRDMQRILRQAVNAEGFNVGINIGRCAGAGLPGHLHVHIVPRWSGDTNFMSVFAGARVIPQSLEALYRQMRQAGQDLRLPEVSMPSP